MFILLKSLVGARQGDNLSPTQETSFAMSVPYVSFWQWIHHRIMWHLPCEIQILYT